MKELIIDSTYVTGKIHTYKFNVEKISENDEQIVYKAIPREDGIIGTLIQDKSN